MATGSYLLIITLNVNGLNSPTKRQRRAEWMQKQDPHTLDCWGPLTIRNVRWHVAALEGPSNSRLTPKEMGGYE